MSGWNSVTLDDVADEITVGHVGSMANDYRESGVPFLRSLNVEPFRLRLEEVKFIDRDFHRRLRKSALAPGDVVIVRTGKPGACAVIPEHLPESNCSDLVIVRCGERLRPHFLGYVVNSLAAHHIDSHTVGAVQQHFNVGSARTLAFRLPPLSVQDTILEVLKTIDDKIELNRRMNETLEASARALFRDWFIDFGPTCAKAEGRPPYLAPDLWSLFPNRFGEHGVPEGWTKGCIADCCSAIFSGGTPATGRAEYWGGGIPWLSSGETRNLIISETDRTITRQGASESSTRLAPARSTVIASAGQGNTRGQSSMIVNEMYINQSVIACVANPEATTDFLLFLDIFGRYDEIRQISDSNSSRGSLTTKMVGGLPTIIPSKALAHKLSAPLEALFEEIIANVTESRTLAATRDALLPKLMSGEISVRHAEALAA